MIEELKRTLYAGLGAGAVTYEKVEEVLQDLVAKGKISADEARATANKVVEESKAEFDQSTSAVQKQFEKLLDRASVAKKRDLDAMRQRIDALEKAVEELSKPAKKSS